MKALITFSFAIFFTMTLLVRGAFAENSINSGQNVSEASNSNRMKDKLGTGKPAGKVEQNASNLKTRAEAEIDRRIASLNQLLSRIGNINRLSAEQKNSFTSQVQAQITSLTTLRAKIVADSDTDIATLKADVQSIMTSYRIYAVFMPQIHLLAAANEILNAADSLTNAQTVLQTSINEAKAKGQDVTVSQAALTDMQAKIADAKANAQKVLTTVAALTPQGYPGNKVTMQAAQANLKTARADIEAALKDAKIIIPNLRSFLKTQGTPSVTSSPSATSIPTQ